MLSRFSKVTLPAPSQFMPCHCKHGIVGSMSAAVKFHGALPFHDQWLPLVAVYSFFKIVYSPALISDCIFIRVSEWSKVLKIKNYVYIIAVCKASF